MIQHLLFVIWMCMFALKVIGGEDYIEMTIKSDSKMKIFKILDFLKLWMMQFCEFITPVYRLQLKIFQRKSHILFKELSNIILHAQFKGYLLIVSWILMVGNLIVSLSFNHSFIIIWISNLQMENPNSFQNLKLFSIDKKGSIWTRFDIHTFITKT